MKSNPLQQKQHRISQVYLKQFGFKKEERWYVRALNFRKDIEEEHLVEQFTTEINAFDIPVDNFETRRHFENTSRIVENRYPTILRNLEHQLKLLPKDRDYLCHFLPSLKCRNGHYRMVLADLIRMPEMRQGLIDEITLLKGDKEDIAILLKMLKEEAHVNIIIGFLMNHLVSIFRHFSFTVFKAPADCQWLSTDNPVHMELQEIDGLLMSHETEVYFALSPQYCLFVYHEEAEKNSNPLRKLKKDCVIPIDYSQFHEIQMKILARDKNYTNDYDHVIIPI